MGAWGVTNFENDTAMDFVETVLVEGRSLVKYAIQKVANMRREDYLECEDCEECLAAMEFVAAATGHPTENLPGEVVDWVKKNDLLREEDVTVQKFIRSNDDIIGQCLSALYRIRNASELKEMWQETEDFEAWQKVLDDLKTRLSA